MSKLTTLMKMEMRGWWTLDTSRLLLKACAEGGSSLAQRLLERWFREKSKKAMLLVAQIAGIQRQNLRLDPLCHPLGLTGIGIEAQTEHRQSACFRTGAMRWQDRSGNGGFVCRECIFCVYDMVKAIDKSAPSDHAAAFKDRWCLRELGSV